MSRFGNRLSIISLVLLVAAVITSCTQPDDILTGVSNSTLTLTAERLPTPPTGMIYQFWLSKVADPDTTVATSDILPLARFSYLHNDTVNTFLDDTGAARTNILEISDDILKYKSVFVSLELVDDPDSSRPGPIMLTGALSSDPDAILRLNFPQSSALFESTCWFNMMTVSDEDPGGIGQGIWFTGWRTETRSLPDTIGLTADSSRWDTMVIERDPLPPHDITNLDSLTRPYPNVLDSVFLDTVYYFFGQDSSVYDTFIYGADSFQHIRMHYKIVDRIDNDSPYTRRNLKITVDTVAHRIPLQIFSQQEFGFPLIDRYGWKYSGWVVTPTLGDKAPQAIGSFTAPGYPTVSGGKNWFSGSTGGLISTGTFSRIDSSDDQNQFQLGVHRIPGYPGEEFTNTSLVQQVFGVPQINFIPTQTGNSGNVFITMEPANRLTDTTNFPLIAYSVDIPSNRVSLADPALTSVQFRMYNLTGTVPGYLNMGFPEISAKVKRF